MSLVGDMNDDGSLSVYDVLILVGIILDGDSGDIFDVMEIIKEYRGSYEKVYINISYTCIIVKYLNRSNQIGRYQILMLQTILEKY